MDLVGACTMRQLRLLVLQCMLWWADAVHVHVAAEVCHDPGHLILCSLYKEQQYSRRLFCCQYKPNHSPLHSCCAACGVFCRQLVRERERDKDRQRDAAKERERHMRADLEAAESDDEVEPWQRRPIRHR